MASSAMRDRSTCSRVKDPLVGAAEQEQGLGEVDRSGVDVVEAVDELAGVAVRIVAGDLEQRLRDRQRGAQLVGGVGGEPLLFGVVGLEPREHGVEGVGELAELVLAAPRWIRWESDPFAVRRVALVMRARGASMLPARIHPPSRPNTSSSASMSGCLRDERIHQVGAVGSRPSGATPSGTYRSRNTHTTASSMVPAIIRNAA